MAALASTGEETASLQIAMTDEAYAEAIEALFAEAEAMKGPGEPALWKVSDYDSTVYLFGTVHALRPQTEWRTPHIDAAFEAADRLIVEVDIHSHGAQQEMIRLWRHYGLFAHGYSLLDYINDDADVETLKAAATRLGLPYQWLLRVKPWLLKSILSGETEYEADANAFQRASGVEEVLLVDALRAGKTLGYIESLDDQMSILPSASMADQVADLIDSLRRETTGPDLLDVLVDEWVDGDVDGLGLIISDPLIQMDKPFYDALLRRRNENWIPKIKIMLNIPGTSFVAVGAAHLAGPDSLIGMLEAQGLTPIRQ